MAIRILSWNLKNFSERQTKAPLLNYILDLVNPVTGAQFEIVVIIEPKLGKKAVRGAIATGGVATAIWNMRTHLRAQSNVEWEVVIPVCLGNGSGKNEALAVYYNASLLDLVGPRTHNNPGANWRTTGGTANNVGTTAGPTSCYGGEWEFGEMEFDATDERRPYMVRFQDKAARQFHIVGAHSPSPETPFNFRAINGTRHLGLIPALSTARTMPAVIMGDFNCCSRANEAGNTYKRTNTRDSQETMAGCCAVSFACGEAGSAHVWVDAALTEARTEAAAAAAAANPVIATQRAQVAGFVSKAVADVVESLPGAQKALTAAAKEAADDACMHGLADENAVAWSDRVVDTMTALERELAIAGSNDSPALALYLETDLAVAAAKAAVAAAAARKEHFVAAALLVLGRVADLASKIEQSDVKAARVTLLAAMEAIRGAVEGDTAQAGGANTITLAAGASVTDGLYNGMPPWTRTRPTISETSGV